MAGGLDLPCLGIGQTPDATPAGRHHRNGRGGGCRRRVMMPCPVPEMTISLHRVPSTTGRMGKRCHLGWPGPQRATCWVRRRPRTRLCQKHRRSVTGLLPSGPWCLTLDGRANTPLVAYSRGLLAVRLPCGRLGGFATSAKLLAFSSDESGCLGNEAKGARQPGRWPREAKDRGQARIIGNRAHPE